MTKSKTLILVISKPDGYSSLSLPSRKYIIRNLLKIIDSHSNSFDGTFKVKVTIHSVGNA